MTGAVRAILRRRAREAARPRSVPQSTEDWLEFSWAGRRLALPLGDLRGVERSQRFWRDTRPGPSSGIVDLRGRVVSVVNPLWEEAGAELDRVPWFLEVELGDRSLALPSEVPGEVEAWSSSTLELGGGGRPPFVGLGPKAQHLLNRSSLSEWLQSVSRV